MNRARMLSGSALVVVGVLVLLDVAGVLDAGAVVGGWWPLLIIAVAFVTWWEDRRRWVPPALLAVLGVAILVETADLIAVDMWSIIWPAALIVVGVRLLWRRRPSGEVSDRIDAFAAFGGNEMASRSSHFEGGTVGTLFGGADVDLRQATPAEHAALDVFVAFGGTDIRVPHGWRVTTRGLPIFGGIDNVTAKEALPDDAPTLDVSATVIFGGVDIKH